MRWRAAACLVPWLTCTTPDANTEPDTAAGDVSTTSAPLLWRDHGEWPVQDDGSTPVVVVDVPAGARSLLIRARPAAGDAPSSVCFTFAAVDAPDGTSRLGTTATGEPVSDEPDDQRGYALGLWPRLGDPALPSGNWRVRAGLVSCGAGAPVGPEALPGGTLRLESAVLPAIAGEPRIRVRRVFAPGLGDTSIATWDAAFRAAWAYLADAGLTAVEVAPLYLTPPLPSLAPLRVGAGLPDVDALASAIDDHDLTTTETAGALDDAPALIVVVPCIDRWIPGGGQTRLAGHATRLPGGPRLPGIASFVVVGTSTCAPPEDGDVDRLARVIAHELGHLLGLPHGTPPSLMSPQPETLADRPALTTAEAAAILASPLVTDFMSK